MVTAPCPESATTADGRSAEQEHTQRIHMKKSLVIAALAAMAAAPAASAQVGDAGVVMGKGFFLATHLNGSSLSLEGEDPESGGGFGLALGYAFTPKVSLFFGFDAAVMEAGNAAYSDGYEFAQGDLGVRFSFTDGTKKLAPYGEVALTGIAAILDDAELSDEVTISGGGLTLGGGLTYFFSRKLAGDVGFRYGIHQFTEAEVDGETVEFDAVDSRTGRFNLGIRWFP